uniref:Prospero homeobox 2 n=1 Tax=Salvator merianae TaxID=96440 RepID=A0A8D0C1N5_SALMN
MCDQTVGPSNAPRDAFLPWHQPSVCDLDSSRQFQNEHLQAKRARVENIIQGMSTMPNPPIMSGALGGSNQLRAQDVKVNCRENKRKQKLPQQQNLQDAALARSGKSSIHADECFQLKKQLHVLQHQLKQIQERFLQPEKTMDLVRGNIGQSLDSDNPTFVSDQGKDNLWRRTPQTQESESSDKEAEMVDFHAMTSEERILSDILKHELIQVVTQAVDSVMRKVLTKSPSLQTQVPTAAPGTQSCTGIELARAGQSGSHNWLPKVSSHKTSIEKPPDFSTCPLHSKIERKPCQGPLMNCPLATSTDVQGSGILSQMLLCGQNGHWNSSPPESLDTPIQPIKLKSSVMRHHRHSKPYKPAEMEHLASLPVPNAEFTETHSLLDTETLTPGHLKKAKLMFFFSRYPASSLLKAYFLDVQFTRCITSQLIKWFSNFREFYYIQMEKFARQAILEGITNPSDLIVTRNSELFRILNIHYNKGNDFEVPDGFLDVASLTLQEFFSAVMAGKDMDPSWKKPIYKIISKLDREIPDAFKSSSCPRELISS